jgi:MFS family permease
VRIVAEVGRIRAFAAIATAIALLHVLWIDLLPWAILRFVHGIAMVGLALIIESWLNAKADTDNRGRSFAIYMVVNLSALAVGQLLRRSPTGVLGCFAVGSPTSTTGVGSSCSSPFSPRSRVSW